MSTYGSKQVHLLKDRRALLDKIRKDKKNIDEKYSVLTKAKNKKPDNFNNKFNVEKFIEGVEKVTNIIASDRYRVLNTEYKTIHYVRQPDYSFDNISRDKIQEKELTSVNKLYKDLSNSLFENVISSSNGTSEELQKKGIKRVEKINYSLNKTKSNMNYQTTKKIYDEILNGKVVAYDLETLGGTSSVTKTWSPKAITEFSFQEMDVKGYRNNQDPTKTIESFINKKTAVMGLDEDLYNHWIDRIEGSLNAYGKITDEELRVTAMRLQMYHFANFSEMDSNGIVTIKKFPGEEAFEGGLNIDYIKSGGKKLVNVRKDSMKYKDVNGVLPDHKLFFEELSRIQKHNIPVVDYNGMSFDQPIINSVMNRILKYDYGDNDTATKYINSLFRNNTPYFAPKRLDVMGVITEASAIKGMKAVLGDNYKHMAEDSGKTRIGRQEHIMESLFPDIMKNSDRHKAEDDTTNLLRMSFQNLDIYRNETSALGNAMRIVDEEHREYDIKFDNKKNKNVKVKRRNSTNMVLTQENMNTSIFRAKGEMTTEGRNALDFSYDPKTKSIKTRNKKIINNSTESSMMSHKGVKSVDFHVGGVLTSGTHYQITNMYEGKVGKDLLGQLVDNAAEYANKKLFVLEISPYFVNDEQRKKYSKYDEQIFKFFNSKDQMEAYISSELELVGKNDGKQVKLFNRNEYSLNEVTDKGVNKVSPHTNKVSNKKLLEDNIEIHYKKRSEEAASRFLSEKTSKRVMDYTNFKEALSKELGLDDIDMEKQLNKVLNLSRSISRGEYEYKDKAKRKLDKKRKVKSKDRVKDVTRHKDYKVYKLALETLGFKDIETNAQTLYDNTIINYINSVEKIEALQPIVNKLHNEFKPKSSSDKINYNVIEEKVKYALNEVFNMTLEHEYKEDYHKVLTKNRLTTKGELSNTYHIDVSKFQSSRKNKYVIGNAVSQLSEDGILSINLKNAKPKSFAEKIRKLKFGDDETKINEKSASVAMSEFVDFLYKNNKHLNKKKLKEIKNEIKNGTINSSIIAEKVLNILKESKKVNFKNGIIPNNYNKLNVLDDLNLINKTVNFVNSNKEVIKKAVNNTPKYELFKNVEDKIPDHIYSIVDNYFMPKVNGLYGEEALNHILKTNASTKNSKIEADIFKRHWNIIRNQHIENISKLNDLIFNTNGSLVLSDGALYAKYGNNAIELKKLARTVYSNSGLLMHQVGTQRVTANMNLEILVNEKTGKSHGLVVSNLKEISSSINRNKSKIIKAQKEGKLTPEIFGVFEGKISKEMQQQSIVMTENIHEIESMNKFGVGKAIGKTLKHFFGTEDKLPALKGHELFDKKAFDIVKKEISKGTLFKGEFTPQITEALAKSIIPIIDNLDTMTEDLEVLKEYLSFSSKDTYIGGNRNIYLHMGADRYSQLVSDPFDAAKRPTLQASKTDYSKKSLEEGMERYLAKNPNKSGFVGTLFNDKKKARERMGVAIGEIDNAITIKKANVGNLGINVIVENHIKALQGRNTVKENINSNLDAVDNYVRAKHMYGRIKEIASTQEQQKIADARLVDELFEQSAEIKIIKNKDIKTYYEESIDIEEMAKTLSNPKASKIKVKKAMEEQKILNRINNNAISFELDSNGNVIVNMPKGSIVKRGERVFNFHNEFDGNSSITSKIDIGRFRQRVLEKTGNIPVSKEGIENFLRNNLELKGTESAKELNIKAMQVLEDHFNVAYTIEDIRQNVYSKFMNDANEKDMTLGLYEKMGLKDKKIANSLKHFNYQGVKGKDLEGLILKKSEIEEIFKNYKAPKGVEDVYENSEALIKAILKERYSLSNFLFDEIKEFKDVSVIANHQTYKHKNYGMISSNVIGSVHSHYLDKNGNDIIKANKEFIEDLKSFDVYDKDTIELSEDGKKIFIKPKQGKEQHSRYNYENIGDKEKTNVLEDVRYLRLGGKDKDGKEIGLKGLIKEKAPHLYHESVKYVDGKEVKHMEVFGEIDTIDLKIGNRTEKDVAVLSKSMSVYQQTIDPETMTTYDHRVIEGLTLKRNAQRLTIEAALVEDKDTRKRMEAKADNMMAKAVDILSGYEEHSSPKKIGKQEFGIYNRTKWSYAVIEAVEKFTNEESNDISEEALMRKRFRKEFIESSMEGVLNKDSETGKYILKEGLEGKSVYKEYVDSLISEKIFNINTDIEFKEEYLKLKEFAHLKDVREDILKVSKDIGQGKVSTRYAEEIYQAKSAINASLFNSNSGEVSLENIQKLGFEKIKATDLSIHGAYGEIGNTNARTIFNSNNLVFLGESFAQNNELDAYIALPKSGQVLKDTDVAREFQSRFKTLQGMLEEYNSPNLYANSDRANELKDRILETSNSIKELIRKNTFDKGGALHDLGTVYTDEAFRLKFSFMDNTHNLEGIGNNDIRAEVISRDSSMLTKAKINGHSIAELEKNGIYTDYAFVNESVFEKLGYFDKKKMMNLESVKNGNLKWNSPEAREEMKEFLRTNGIITNAGRYPMIMDHSEKLTRVYLGDFGGENRALVSVVTALSMNADNDGDSVSFSTIKLKNGDDYLKYKMNKDIESSDFFKELEGMMTYNAIGINQYYNQQSMDDITSELNKAIKNGTITKDIDAIKNKFLFNEILYANNGQSPSKEIMSKNKSILDDYVSKASQLDKSLKDLVPIDIEEINASIEKTMDLASYYDKHLEVLEKTLKDNPDKLKEMGISKKDIDNFRQHAVARTMWYESLAETSSKGRKGSIGPINASLQGIRAGADALYLNSSLKSDIVKHNVVGEIAYELEQEVISAKHGSVVSNITKAQDLKRLTDNYIKETTGENKQLLLDFINGTGESKAQNIDDKTINKIWNKLDSKGIISEKDLNVDIKSLKENLSEKEYEEKITSYKRSFLTNEYAKSLEDISNSPEAKAAKNFYRIGGTGANNRNYTAPITINSAGTAGAAIINSSEYEANKAKTITSEVYDEINRIHFANSSNVKKGGNLVAETVGSFSGKGLAMGALSIAAGVLAAGYAGNAMLQAGASELSKQEAVNNNPGGIEPILLDSGADVTRSSSKGYIINMKATSNKDIRHTKRALRAAASESVGGGINVNMTIRNRELSNEDIEKFITGL